MHIDRPVLTNLRSSSIGTHYSKTSGTIGASSMSSFSANHSNSALMITLFRPGVHFHCDVNFDPFVYMHENNKIYGSFLSCH